MTLFTASENVSVAKLNSINEYILKTADESVTSSTALQNDNHLAYTVATTGTYAFDLHLIASSGANAAGDINVAFSFPTGTMHLQGFGPGLALASGWEFDGVFWAFPSATSGSTALPFGLSATGSGFHNYIHIHGLLIATATGTLQTMWAQFASNANATTVKAGSHLLVHRVA